jgi:uncharacterized protein (DUF58 family)
MNLKEVEKVVAGIQSQLFKNSNSYSVGMLKSHFRGAGIHFKEHQVYVHGDDVRFIDWKLSAKSQTAYVKTFEEERNVEIVVFLEITPSMFMGYNGKSKLQAALELTCLLYLLAQETGDYVKTIIVADEVHNLPSKRGKEGIVFVISILERMGLLTEDGKIDVEFEQKHVASEKKKLSILKSLMARNKEVVIFSDFSTYEDYKDLNKLLYRRNMHCFRIQSPVDNANQIPYSLYGHSSNDFNKKGNFISQDSAFVERRTEDRLKGRIKDLSVKERYLEKFIREMM